VNVPIDSYRRVYDVLGLPGVAREIALGKVDLPSGIVETPFLSYGFPPALIPIWSDGGGPSYCGFWVHWFSERERTIVKVLAEAGYRAFEYARTVEQLVAIVALEQISLDEGIGEETTRFAEQVGLEGLDELAAIVAISGEKVSGLKDRKEFGSRSPTKCYVNGVGYQGDFPTASLDVAKANLERIAGLELSDELGASIAQLPSSPPWLRARSQRPVFGELLARKDFAGAWMSLNSPGWQFAEAKQAMRALALAAGDPAFRVVADAWCEEPHERFGGY
jgi:hypothetical protein